MRAIDVLYIGQNQPVENAYELVFWRKYVAPEVQIIQKTSG